MFRVPVKPYPTRARRSAGSPSPRLTGNASSGSPPAAFRAGARAKNSGTHLRARPRHTRRPLSFAGVWNAFPAPERWCHPFVPFLKARHESRWRSRATLCRSQTQSARRARKGTLRDERTPLRSHVRTRYCAKKRPLRDSTRFQGVFTREEEEERRCSRPLTFRNVHAFRWAPVVAGTSPFRPTSSPVCATPPATPPVRPQGGLAYQISSGCASPRRARYAPRPPPLGKAGLMLVAPLSA